MADFTDFISDEAKKSLNRKIDYQREKFLKGVSTSKHGKKEDPTYLHFRFIFDEGITAQIDPETFLAPSPLFRPFKNPGAPSGIAGAPLPDGTLPGTDNKVDASFATVGDSFFYQSKFRINGMQNVGAFDPQEGAAYMGAQEFLYQRSTQRRDMLNAFRNGFLYINKNSPYYFQSISGLDQLLKSDIKNLHKGASKPQRMGTLTIDCLESIDMRIFALSELYRKGIYDYTYQRSMLPENLRKFRMWLVVTEIRNIQLSYGLGDVLNPFSIPSVASAANSLDSFNSQTGFLDKISGLNQKSTNTDKAPPENNVLGTDELGPYAFIYQFDQCEFDFDDSYPSYGTIDNKGGSQVTNKFKIHVGRVKDYKIQFNQLADILGKNDNVKQMVINDTWGSLESSYRDYDYTGTLGISNLLENMNEADPAGFFKEMASNFITNTVADLKNIGVSKLENALLGNIYGLGGINAGAALRSGFSVANTFNDLKNNGIPNPFKDNSPQGQGLGGPGQRQYPTINEDVYTGTSSQNEENLGNALGDGTNPPGTLSGDVYPNVPGTDLGAPDRQYPANNSDEYNNVPGSDSGVPGRVYPIPEGDIYPGVPGADLGVPDRQYPPNNSDEYNNVPGPDSGVPDRVYPVPGGDVYSTVPGGDLGVPDRQYNTAGGDEYSNVPGSDLGVIGRVYDEPVGDVYSNVPGSDLGAPDRQYPQAGGNEYPEAEIGTEPDFIKVYPDVNNKYPQVNASEYKDSPKGFTENMGDVYKNVPGQDLGGKGRNYESARGDEYQTVDRPSQINLGRTYPKSSNSENS
jgi:hypothetical protein